MWDDRLDVAIYTCEDADIAKKVRKALGRVATSKPFAAN